MSQLIKGFKDAKLLLNLIEIKFFSAKKNKFHTAKIKCLILNKSKNNNILSIVFLCHFKLK